MKTVLPSYFQESFLLYQLLNIILGNKIFLRFLCYFSERLLLPVVYHCGQALIFQQRFVKQKLFRCTRLLEQEKDDYLSRRGQNKIWQVL